MDQQELQKLKNKFDIIGGNPALNLAIETAVAVAPYDLTVLVEGESGVGKEAFPQIIHQLSRRRTGKYLAVNCGGIPSGTINAELFGHEKGAFTGAVAERKGYFEEADGGTLFLDEVGELPLETQAMLLRVIQNGEFIKVGSSKVEKTDVRVIAATNVNLEYAVATGKFRADLYYRLSGIKVCVPALRDRKDDIYLLWRKFSSDFAERNGLCKVNLTHEAISVLSAYRWPGNIRQLKNIAEAVTGIESRPVSAALERVDVGSDRLRRYLPDEQDTLLPAAVLGRGSEGRLSDPDKQMMIKAILDLKQEVDNLKRIVGDGAVPQHASIPARVVEYEREEPEEQFETQAAGTAAPAEPTTIRKMGDDLIERTLAKYGGKVGPAARELGISDRTIYRKLAKDKKK